MVGCSCEEVGTGEESWRTETRVTVYSDLPKCGYRLRAIERDSVEVSPKTKDGVTGCDESPSIATGTVTVQVTGEDSNVGGDGRVSCPRNLPSEKTSELRRKESGTRRGEEPQRKTEDGERTTDRETRGVRSFTVLSEDYEDRTRQST